MEPESLTSLLTLLGYLWKLWIPLLACLHDVTIQMTPTVELEHVLFVVNLPFSVQINKMFEVI